MNSGVIQPERGRGDTVAYVAPFLVFVGVMAAERAIALPPHILYPVRFILVLSTILLFSRRVITLRPSYPLGTLAVGIAVFVIWVAPDVLFGYRRHWLFDNSVFGSPVTTATPELKQNVAFIIIRTLGCTALVPILEELFWRGWLMRWLIDKEFQKVPLGQYVPSAFWIVVILFASEHGPYWEVGLIAGVIYNWWIIRTRNLADCIWAHAVTNGILSAYVLLTDQWQYWL